MNADHLSSALSGGEPNPGEFSPTDWMFTTATIAGARTLLAGLDAPGELWEHGGRYYPVRARSRDATWLQAAGATLIPPEDDLLHHGLDQYLKTLTDSTSE
jgi:hypothetical protein